MVRVNSQNFTTVYQGGEKYSPAHLDLRLKSDAASAPQVLLEFTVGGTGFDEVVICFIIKCEMDKERFQ